MVGFGFTTPVYYTLTGMLPSVCGQYTFKPKTLSTKLATKWHSASVNSVVLLQSAPFSKSPSAYIALIRFQSGMN